MLTIILYSLLASESVIKAIVIVIIILQEKGRYILIFTFLCSPVLLSGYCDSRVEYDKLRCHSDLQIIPRLRRLVCYIACAFYYFTGLTHIKAVSNGIRNSSPGPCYLQGCRVLETEWFSRVTTRSHPDKRSGDVFFSVSSSTLREHHSIVLAMLSRTIFVVVFALLGDILDLGTLAEVGIFLGLGSPRILCILGSRKFFNLKEAAEHGVNVGTNWSSYSHSAIRFHEAPNGENQ